MPKFNRGYAREHRRGYGREFSRRYRREYSRGYNRDYHRDYVREEVFVMKNDPKYFVSNDPNHPDYKSGLRQIGFYLDPTIDKVDLNTIPKNGTEFIVKSKMQEEAMGLYNCYEDDEYVIEDLFVALRRA
ncbi:hypothetical protein X975_14682, partial [Stegodyphus mimosarum]